MATPWRAYAEVAHKHAKVDPRQHEAVERFFLETLETLPSAEQEQVLEELLAGESDTDEKPVKRAYPTGVEMPRMDGRKELVLPEQNANSIEPISQDVTGSQAKDSVSGIAPRLLACLLSRMVKERSLSLTPAAGEEFARYFETLISELSKEAFERGCDTLEEKDVHRFLENR